MGFMNAMGDSRSALTKVTKKMCCFEFRKDETAVSHADCLEFFRQIDADGDDHITVDEYLRHTFNTGVAAMFEELDTLRDGYVGIMSVSKNLNNMSSFVCLPIRTACAAFWGKDERNIAVVDLTNYLRKVDRDNDNKVRLEELRTHVLDNLPRAGPQSRGREPRSSYISTSHWSGDCAEVFAYLDTNANDFVTVAEFIDGLNNGYGEISELLRHSCSRHLCRLE